MIALPGKLRLKILFVVVLIIFLSSCKRTIWQEFESVEGGFTVLMPGEVESQTIKANTAIGPIDFHMFSVEKKDIVFGVVYNDYPDSIIEGTSPDSLLTSARNGAVGALQGQLLIEIIISSDGYPGREIMIEGPSGETTYQSRMFLAGNRLYQVTVNSMKEKKFLKDIEIFFDSFKILKSTDH